MRHLLFLVLGALPAPLLAQAAPPQWSQCAVCHAVKPGGPKKLGPELRGIVGAPVAAKPGFAYSKALKEMGGVWTDARLDAYLLQPSKTVAGTTMVFPGLKDAKARAAVIGYLKTLK